MPQPTSSQVHVDAVLTNLSVAYIQSASEFVADKVFPVVPVDKQSDRYLKYEKNDWFRDEAKKRAPGTESAGGGYNIDNTPTYFCDVWSFHKDIPWQLRDNADAGIDLDRDATQFVTQRLLIRREREFSDKYFKAGVWANDYTGVTTNPAAGQFIKWSDYTNSNPINDIKNGRLVIKSTTGFWPNTLLLGVEAFETLKSHPDILDRYKYTQAGIITAELIAKVFEVDRIVIGGAVYATNEEGATEAYQFIHGKSALLCYAAPRPSLLAPSAGYIFSWRGLTGSMGYWIGMDKFSIRRLKSDRVEGEIAFDCKVIGSDLGAFYANCVS
jgi:hypothetical protein